MPWNLVVGELVLGIGAALAIGTGAALVRYWRTGRFPAQEQDAAPSLLTAWAKVGLGLVLVIWGVATLDRAGLF
ncbi:MAG TPA: hypothetical protein VHF25_13295 [Nitriliruptorales bacterium]|nr:hypothetical protein [Nitriliruptorales bacterium]